MTPRSDPFVWHRAPLAHQRRDWERFKDAPIIPLFHEQRTRKTKIILDVWRYRTWWRGDVDALLVFADPNGVQQVWLDELPKDLTPDELAATRTLAWRGGQANTRRGRDAALALSVKDHPGPVVATFYCDTLRTDKGWKYINWLLRQRRAMVVADESSWASNWSGRTKRLLTLGNFFSARSFPNVIVKAILDGTPVDEGPDDVFFPTQFLQRGLLGFDSPEAFRARYHRYEEEEVEERDPVTGRTALVRRAVMRTNYKTGSSYKVHLGYRNLDELAAKLAAVGSRVTRADVSDAPPKTYQHRYFELTPRQRAVYDAARERYVAELVRGERTLADALLRVTRLDQIARNWYPAETAAVPCPACDGTPTGCGCEACDGTGVQLERIPLERIDDRSPALEALRAELKAARGPAIVWCRFRQDVADCVAAAADIGLTLLPYDGSLPAAEREANYQAFRAGQGDGMAGIVTSGLSKGKDLTRASLLIYYSNWYGLRARRQSEDRAEGLDRTVSTGVVDLVAADTRDLARIEALRGKRALAETLMGDKPTEWI